MTKSMSERVEKIRKSYRDLINYEWTTDDLDFLFSVIDSVVEEHLSMANKRYVLADYHNAKVKELEADIEVHKDTITTNSCRHVEEIQTLEAENKELKDKLIFSKDKIRKINLGFEECSIAHTSSLEREQELEAKLKKAEIGLEKALKKIDIMIEAEGE